MKESFSSRIAELHGFVNELNLKSNLSSEKLNGQVSLHTSDLEDVSTLH
jgi:kinesin family protein 11